MIDLKKIRTLCCICLTKRATQHHHKFENTKLNRKLYGGLMDDESNIQNVCADCHPEALHQSEEEFCENIGIVPRSKIGQMKYWRNKTK